LEAVSTFVRVLVPLASPGDPLRGHGPQIIPGPELIPKEQIMEWLIGSDANYQFAIEQKWIEEVEKL
jgi:hypothetical protein